MIAIRKSDGLALYAGKLSLTAEGLVGEGFIDRRLNPSNAELLDIPTPENFRGRGYVWNGTILTIRPQYETKLFQEKKKALFDGLKSVYAQKLDAATIDGILISDITDQIQDAATIVLNGVATNHVVISDNDATLLNAAKLNAIYTYKAACSTNAISHRQAIAALTTLAEVDGYDLSTGWPGTSL